MLSIRSLETPQLDIRFLILFLLMVVLGARLVVHIPSIKGEITVNDSFVFLTMLDTLEAYTLDELRDFARMAVPHLRPPKDGDV